VIPTLQKTILMKGKMSVSWGLMCDVWLYLNYMGIVLTVLTRCVGGGILFLALVVFVELYLLDDFIEKVVEKLVRVLVHNAAEVLVSIAKLVDKSTRGHDALVCRIPGDVHVERAEGGEECRGRRGDDDGWSGRG
jgi:hypothetical protein